MWFLVLCLMIVGVVAVDHNKGGNLLPNSLYCELGAGVKHTWAGSSTTRTERQPDWAATSSRSYTTYEPGGTMCYHGSLWEGWDLLGEKQRREEEVRRVKEEEQKKRQEESARLQAENARLAIQRDEERMARMKAENAAREAGAVARDLANGRAPSSSPGSFFSDPPTRDRMKRNW